MMKCRIIEILRGVRRLGEVVSVSGWVRTRRDSKMGFSFVSLCDGSSQMPLQLVVSSELDEYSAIMKLTAGCSVTAVGQIVSSKGRGQSVELQISKIKVLGWVEDPESYPLQPKKHSLEYLREIAHLRPRSSTFGALARIRHHMALAIHRFFDQEGFYWVQTPIITASDCEGAGNMFRVSTLDEGNPPRLPNGLIDYSQDFFGRQTFLTVSGQLNVEAYCQAMGRVYTFGPTFRAENSNTRRHLAEFWMVEPEMAFADLNDDIALAERLCKAMFSHCIDRCSEEIEFLETRAAQGIRLIDRLQKFLNKKPVVIAYGDAINILDRASKTARFEYQPTWGEELHAEHERYLAEKVVGGPVVVINPPKSNRAFYMRLNDDGMTVAAMDLLAPGIGEIAGGSQREERIDKLDQRIEEMGLSVDRYGWYRDLRRYGTVPHAGFGLGFERAIQYVAGVDNVRDVSPFPRARRQADF